MATIEFLEAEWRNWRHKRITELTAPYGPPALVAQHWLQDDSSGVQLDGLPGLWSVDAGRVMFTPPADGPNLSVDDSYPTEPVEVIPGRNQLFGHGEAVAVYFGTLEITTVHRITDDDDNVYAVRVWDPEEAARKDFRKLTAFDYDPAWRLPATFHPAPPVDEHIVSVEASVREMVTKIGTLSFTIDGEEYSVEVIGKESVRGILPVMLLRDATSGDETYEVGRIMELEWADDARDRIDFVDLNYLMALPCAFTNFVTCPLVPKRNHVRAAVTAGEKKPDVTLERISTYAS